MGHILGKEAGVAISALGGSSPQIQPRNVVCKTNGSSISIKSEISETDGDDDGDDDDDDGDDHGDDHEPM